MAKIHSYLQKNPQSKILLQAQPDDICQACPHLKQGCTLHGPGTEKSMESQDQEVLKRLDLKAGEMITWKEVLERISKKISSSELPKICGNCPWLPLGYCESAIDQLKNPK